MEGVGVRELRQHASRYLARVAAGETLQVTDRGRPVALLVPVVVDRWEDLVRRGQVQPPVDDVALEDERAADYGLDASAVLTAARHDER
jgi:prevent-host-death family protein